MNLPPEFRWNEYTLPNSAISAVVQQPVYKITPEAVIAAYMRDERRKRITIDT